jgi:hypothetical protein
MMTRKVAIVGADRIPLVRQGTANAKLSNLTMLTGRACEGRESVYRPFSRRSRLT